MLEESQIFHRSITHHVPKDDGTESYSIFTEADVQLDKLQNAWIDDQTILVSGSQDGGASYIFTVGTDLGSLGSPSLVNWLEFEAKRPRTALERNLSYLQFPFSSMFAPGDFDGTGQLDLMTVTPDKTLDIYLERGGIYEPAQAFSLDERGASTRFLAAADLNNDKIDDIVVVLTSVLEVTPRVFLANGDGTFRPVNQDFDMTDPSGILIEDFDRDGKPDMILTGQDGGRFLPGNGDGTFGTKIPLPISVEFVAGIVGARFLPADFDRDGRLDLVMIDQNLVQIAFGLGNGRFQTPVAIEAIMGGDNFSPSFLDVEDLDGELGPDLVVVSSESNEVVILLNQGDGSFQPAENPVVGAGISGVVSGDLNDDGLNDLICIRPHGPDLTVLLGQAGDTPFEAGIELEQLLSDIDYPSAIVADDFNGDGHLDVAVSDSGSIPGQIIVLYGDGAGPFNQSPPIPVGLRTTQLVTVRNREGDFVELLALNAGSRNLSRLEFRGADWLELERILLGIEVTAIEVAALYTAVPEGSASDRPDVLVLSQQEGAIFVMERQAVGGFDNDTPLRELASGLDNPILMATAHLNDDDIPDLIVVEADEQKTIAVFYGEYTEVGHNEWQYRLVNPLTPAGNFLSMPTSLTIIDWDADGILDFVLTSHVEPYLSVFLGSSTDDGDIFYELSEKDMSDFGLSGIAVVDCDDGNQQVVGFTEFPASSSPDAANDLVILRDSEGPTTTTPLPTTALEIVDLAGGDANEDGIADLAILMRGRTAQGGDPVEGIVAILKGSGGPLGSLVLLPDSPSTPYLKWASALQIEDVNGDGWSDLAIVSTAGNSVDYLLGPGFSYEVENRATTLTPIGGVAPVVLAVGAFSDGSWTLAGDTVLIEDRALAISQSVSLSFPSEGSRVIAAVPEMNVSGSVDELPSLVVLVATETGGSILTFAGNDLLQAARMPGDRTVHPQAEVPLNHVPSAFATSDLDGDGRYDFIVVYRDSDEVLLVFGAGSTVKLSTGNGQSSCLLVGDLNNDSLPDLVIGSEFSHELIAFYGKGSGSFNQGLSLGLLDSPRENGLVLADLNNDGRLDIAAVHNRPDYISILYNTYGPTLEEMMVPIGLSDGSITIRQQVFSPASPVASANPVPQPDPVIETPSPTPPGVVVETPVEPSTPGFAHGGFVARGPLNMVPMQSESRTDLFIVCPESDTLSLLSGTGRREDPFTWVSTIQLDVGANDFSIGDFDHDGNIDAAILRTAANALTIVWGGKSPVEMTDLPTAVAPFAVASGAVNEGIHEVLAVSSSGADDVALFYKTGAGRLFMGTQIVGPEVSGQLLTADLNSDGDADFVIADRSLGTLFFVINTSPKAGETISFESYSLDLPMGTQVARLLVNDVNQDGAADVIAVSQAPSNLYVFLNDGFGNFHDFSTYPIAASWQDLLFRDFTGDGLPDLALIDVFSRTVLLYANAGNGTFSVRSSVFMASDDPRTVAAADVDGDGAQDLLMSTGSGEIWVLWGSGDDEGFEPEAEKLLITKP